MSVLGRRAILDRLRREKLKERLIVTPILRDSQIGAGSIDLRLANEFIVVRRGNMDVVDPARDGQDAKKAEARHYVNFGSKFYLHPDELVLASSLEYVRLPKDVAGSVTTRSSWGRVGLVIATATAVHPGFTGTITLELLNHGEVPLALYPGISVAQLVLTDSLGAEEYKGRFSTQTGPRVGSVGDEKQDLEFWVTPRKGGRF